MMVQGEFYGREGEGESMPVSLHHNQEDNISHSHHHTSESGALQGRPPLNDFSGWEGSYGRGQPFKHPGLSPFLTYGWCINLSILVYWTIPKQHLYEHGSGNRFRHITLLVATPTVPPPLCFRKFLDPQVCIFGLWGMDCMEWRGDKKDLCCERSSQIQPILEQLPFCFFPYSIPYAFGSFSCFFEKFPIDFRSEVAFYF